MTPAMIDLESMTPAQRAHLVATLTEERDAARRALNYVEQALQEASITAPGTVADRVRALAAKYHAAAWENNDKDDRLGRANKEVCNLHDQLDTASSALAAAETERDALRADVRRLARMVARLAGAP